MYKKFSYFVATMFGVGYCPFASGTAGSLATLPFAFAAAYYGGTVGIAAAAVVVFFAGTLATKEVLKYTKHDPSIVVIDETAGQLFTFVAVADQLTGAADWRAFLLYLFGFGLFQAAAGALGGFQGLKRLGRDAGRYFCRRLRGGYTLCYFHLSVRGIVSRLQAGGFFAGSGDKTPDAADFCGRFEK